MKLRWRSTAEEAELVGVESGAVDLFTLSLSRLIRIREGVSESITALPLAEEVEDALVVASRGSSLTSVIRAEWEGPGRENPLRWSRSLLPHTHSPNELWLPILCKALLKVIGLR